MDAAVLEHLRTWIGRSRSDEDVISVRHARLMAATVEYPPERLGEGESLPPLWHWLYFLEGSPPAGLGQDGHPARGAFLPPVPLSNRMWAGGRVAFLQPVPLGATMRKESRILKVEHKQGRSGDLVFVTVLHELVSTLGEVCLREEHDIVYKEPAPVMAMPAGATVPKRQFTERFKPTSTTLFRYSALTFNGHRIHYDADYCREVEGYRNLVVHGPLVATMLAGFSERMTKGRLAEFSYRGLAPAMLGEEVALQADVVGNIVDLEAVLENGQVSMQARAVLR